MTKIKLFSGALAIGSAIAAAGACGGKIWDDPDCRTLSGFYRYPVIVGKEVDGGAACPNLEGAGIEFNTNIVDRSIGFWSGTPQPPALTDYTTPTGGGVYDRATCTANMRWNEDKPYFNTCPESVVVSVTFDDAGSFTGTLRIDVKCNPGGGTSLSCAYPFHVGHESSGRL